MNRKTIILSLAGVLIVGLILVFNRTSSTPPPSDAAGMPTTAEPLVQGITPPPAPVNYRKWSLPEPPAAVTTPPTPVQLVPVPAAEGQPATQAVMLRAGQVLATVNQIPITLNDLMAVGADQAEVTLDPVEYEARLAKAVEAEVTLQAARLKGVNLQPMQQDRIAAIAQRYADTFAKYKEQGVTWSSVTPEQIALEERQVAASVLQQNLVLKQAGVGPSPDPAVQARYEQARRQMLDQLQASASIAKAAPVL